MGRGGALCLVAGQSMSDNRLLAGLSAVVPAFSQSDIEHAKLETNLRGSSINLEGVNQQLGNVAGPVVSGLRRGRTVVVRNAENRPCHTRCLSDSMSYVNLVRFPLEVVCK